MRIGESRNFVLRVIFLSLVTLLAACTSSSSPDAALTEWPAFRTGENPPPAPAEVEAVITNVDALAAVLPLNAVARLFDPVALGTTIRDITDPVLLAFTVRATLAQLQDGSRINQVYNWYGSPYYNEGVAIVPVTFKNRYGTSLYGEIVLPKRGTVPPTAGPFASILALEGVMTNLAMYRWWHQAFADAGYLVFAFDFAGQGHSGDRVANDTGTNITDSQDALTYLLHDSPVRSVLDKNRTGVIGHSLGAITTLGLQAVEPRLHAAVAAAPISEDSAPFDKNPIPTMIQTGDHDGPVAPIPFVNPAIVRPVYEKLSGDRAFVVAEASSHAQWTNYPLLPTAQWGFDIAKIYSVAWMDYHLQHDPVALTTLRTAHPHLSYLWDSEVRVDDQVTIMRGAGPTLQ
ncbi:alpha/beta hydrolase family protein [Stenotrophobium rhamnosiphilum]|uniref:Alpha/beta hydrolase n=1 Tax=Stenotrophobium rhamnosiphilum TaxID=2029166 RepID=A0A2T5MBZ7_9GAMM|nr:alpha/beta fold hydrolase [Stenotrophobium rhamnosiphilum]PTU30106.1 alpha/beta hydrolase [Stenotrophobium rhamnosiphilum]